MPRTQDVRGKNVFDSRNAIARRDELAEELADQLSAEETPEGVARARAEWDSSDEAEELRDLEAFISEASGYGDFEHGETCVRDDYFEEYAQELAEDVCEGYRKQSQNWPFTCIDWEKAAEELQQDYTSAELAGVTYWFRS